MGYALFIANRSEAKDSKSLTPVPFLLNTRPSSTTKNVASLAGARLTPFSPLDLGESRFPAADCPLSGFFGQPFRTNDFCYSSRPHSCNIRAGRPLAKVPRPVQSISKEKPRPISGVHDKRTYFAIPFAPLFAVMVSEAVSTHSLISTRTNSAACCDPPTRRTPAVRHSPMLQRLVAYSGSSCKDILPYVDFKNTTLSICSRQGRRQGCFLSLVTCLKSYNPAGP